MRPPRRGPGAWRHAPGAGALPASVAVKTTAAGRPALGETPRDGHAAAMSDAELATELYRLVALVRATELRLQQHISEHGFGGFWHPGIGQEGLQVGAACALRTDDYLFY